MKNYFLTTLAIAALVYPIHAGDNIDWAKLEPQTVLKAIATFESDPTGTNGPGAMTLIVNYAEVSTNVTVTVNSGYLPWVSREPKIRNGELLLTAFVAGNVQTQLQQGVKKDYPVEGILLMCRVYTTLRRKDQIERIPEMEKWSKLDKGGVKDLVPKIKRKDSQ